MAWFVWIKYLFRRENLDLLGQNMLIRKIKICTILSADFYNIAPGIMQYLLYLQKSKISYGYPIADIPDKAGADSRQLCQIVS